VEASPLPHELREGNPSGYPEPPAAMVRDASVSNAEPTGRLSPSADRKAARLVRLARDAIYRRSLALADALAAATALVGSIAVVGTGHAGLATLLTVPLIVVMGKLLGTYDREDLLIRKSTLDEAPALFQLATLYALSAWLIDGVVVTGAHGRRELIVLWASLFVLLLIYRAAARVVSRIATAPERCLVIGDQATCDRMELKFARSRSSHARVVGCLVPYSQDPNEAVAPLSARDLGAAISRLCVDRLIIAPVRADEQELIEAVRLATAFGLKVSVVPKVLEVIGSSVQIDDVEGVPLLSTRSVGLTRSSRMVKRTLDLVGSSVVLVALAPLLALIAVAIKLDTGGAVFFRQRRVGRDGTSFQMLKFRTMVSDAEERKHEFRHLNEAEGIFKIADDPRITRVGRLLRRSSLDELPQLLHVFRGEMSLVGPRPLIAEEDVQIEGWRRRRLQLTPGMTGTWQVLGSSRIPLEEMARIDYVYVSNWSLGLDLKILLRTIPHVFAARGL
jgi:exopolysaccharide biosynthesis polyprenyl glycosylphosphotransferase